ncbi:MAG: glycosyltransferase family 2 protein [Planctomycetes bacterium]|nr:glycosyltransferase family 2 protein [Planctomycetota bacterium]
MLPLRSPQVGMSVACEVLVAALPAGQPAGPAQLRARGGVLGFAVRIAHEDATGGIVTGWMAAPAQEVSLLLFLHPRVQELRVLVQAGLPPPQLELVQIGWPEALLRVVVGEGGAGPVLSRLLRLITAPFDSFRCARVASNLPMAITRGQRRMSPLGEDRELRFLHRVGMLAATRTGDSPMPVLVVVLLPHASGWEGWQDSLASIAGSGARVLVAGWAGMPPAGLPGADAQVAVTGSGLDGGWWTAGGPEGAWVIPLRAGDRLAAGWQERLAVMAGQPGADLVYGDEDRIDAGGRHGRARFKPGWSPETLLGGNYLGRALAVRGDLWIKAGGWEGDGGEAAFFACVQRCAAAAGRIGHLPLIQLHRGGGPGGSSEAVQAVAQAGCRRRGIEAAVIPAAGVPGRFLVRPVVRGRPLVSVIIPTRDGADILRVCLETLFARTGYQEFEVLVVDNGSVQEGTRRLFAEAEGRWKGRFRVLPLDIPFNYSRLNNVAAEAAAGEHLLLLNNDIEIIEPGWLEAMLGWAQQPGIGFVGAKLLYPDRSVQHIGVTVGIGGGADHLHKGASRHEAGYQGCLQTVCNWTAATAACLLVPRPVWRQVGGLDESFAVAFNDVDFCLRVGAAGYRGVVTPAAELIHHESKSRGLDDTPAKRARFLGELARLRERWGTDRLVDPALGELISRGSLDPDCTRPSLSSGG